MRLAPRKFSNCDMMAVSVPAMEDKASFTREIQTQAVGQIRGDPENNRKASIPWAHPGTCILISIFLVWLTPNRKMGLPSGLQAGGQRFTRERPALAGSQALRGAARSAWTHRSKLEPLLEHAGLWSAGLVFLQV